MTNGHNKSVVFILLLLLLLQLLMPLRYTRLLLLQNINVVYTHTHTRTHVLYTVLLYYCRYLWSTHWTSKKTDGTRLKRIVSNPPSLSEQYILYTCMVRVIRHGNVWCDNDRGPDIWNGNRRTGTCGLSSGKK